MNGHETGAGSIHKSTTHGSLIVKKKPEQRCDFASLKQNALIKQQQRQLLLVQTSDDCYSVNNRLRISNLNNLPNSSCVKANSS